MNIEHPTLNIEVEEIEGFESRMGTKEREGGGEEIGHERGEGRRSESRKSQVDEEAAFSSIYYLRSAIPSFSASLGDLCGLAVKYSFQMKMLARCPLSLKTRAGRPCPSLKKQALLRILTFDLRPLQTLFLLFPDAC
jgi:hypothetical protein